jgi:hypothetical protein
MPDPEHDQHLPTVNASIVEERACGDRPGPVAAPRADRTRDGPRTDVVGVTLPIAPVRIPCGGRLGPRAAVPD